MAGLAGKDCSGVGLVPAEHRRVAEHLGRGPTGCNAPRQGQHHKRALVLAWTGARSKGQAPAEVPTQKGELSQEQQCSY